MKVDVVEELGSEKNLIFALDVPPVVTDATQVGGAPTRPRRRSWPAPAGRSAPPRSTIAAPAAPGDLYRLAVEIDTMHFFDLATSAVIGLPPTVPAPS